MSKVLIIGQAPPAVKQEVPYDTTLLYDWLKEIGISKAEAQNIFDFDAMTDKFPGHAKNGTHLRPQTLDMINHYESILKHKIQNSRCVILLGTVPKEFFNKNFMRGTLGDKKVFYMLHPSRRNISKFRQNREEILNTFKTAINHL